MTNDRRRGTDRRKENRGWAARPVRSGIDRRVSPEHETWSVEEGDLWRPRCSCGWVSESVYSPVRRARQEEANHSRAARRASQQEQDGAAVLPAASNDSGHHRGVPGASAGTDPAAHEASPANRRWVRGARTGAPGAEARPSGEPEVDGLIADFADAVVDAAYTQDEVDRLAIDEPGSDFPVMPEHMAAYKVALDRMKEASMHAAITRNALRAALRTPASVAQPQEWQPIESAPTDRAIMMYDVAFGVYDIGRLWSPETMPQPTHWMPLPAAPTDRRVTEDGP